MKNLILTLILCLTLGLGFTSCTKDDFDNIENKELFYVDKPTSLPFCDYVNSLVEISTQNGFTYLGNTDMYEKELSIYTGDEEDIDSILVNRLKLSNYKITNIKYDRIQGIEILWQVDVALESGDGIHIHHLFDRENFYDKPMDNSYILYISCGHRY